MEKPKFLLKLAHECYGGIIHNGKEVETTQLSNW